MKCYICGIESPYIAAAPIAEYQYPLCQNCRDEVIEHVETLHVMSLTRTSKPKGKAK